MARIAFIGAGSVEFTKTLVADLLAYPELGEVELRLHYIDLRRGARLADSGRAAQASG